MTDFRKSFQIGLEAHHEANRARHEIEEVFRIFAEQVHEASSGHVRIGRERRRQRGDDDLGRVFSRHGGAPLHGMPDRRPTRTYEAVVARGPGISEEVLCEYELSRHAYPVIIRYGRTHDRCQDRKSLEHALRVLLEDPETGGKLHRLMTVAAAAGSAK